MELYVDREDWGPLNKGDSPRKIGLEKSLGRKDGSKCARLEDLDRTL